MNTSYVLSFADGSYRQVMAGDKDAARVIEILARAMKLAPSGAAEHPLLILTGQETEAFSMTGSAMVCGFPVPENKDELVSSAMEVSLAIAHATQRRGGVLVHGGLAEYEGSGVILAAPGGTGKSTAVSRLPEPWRSLSDDAALIVRDPQGNYFAHPWPTWSLFYENGPGGQWNTGVAVPLKALYFLFQSQEDDLEKLIPTQAAAMLIESVEQANRVFDRRLSHTEIQGNHLQQFSIVCALTARLPAYRLRLSLTGEFWKLIEGSINPDRSSDMASGFPSANRREARKLGLLHAYAKVPKPNASECNTNLQSITVDKGNLFLVASIRGRLGTLPLNWSVPAARPRSGRFSLSERHKRVRESNASEALQGKTPGAASERSWFSLNINSIANWYRPLERNERVCGEESDTTSVPCGKSGAKQHISSGKGSRIDTAVPAGVKDTQVAPPGVVFSGNSMYPTLKEPDYLEVCPYNGARPRRGDVVYFRDPRTGMMVVHRITEVRTHGLLTKGDNNPQHDPGLVPWSALEGRVVATEGSGRKRRIRGGTAGMMDYYYALAFRKARIMAGRLYRLFSRYCPLMEIMISLAYNRVQFKFILFGKMPLGHMKIFANDRCVGQYVRGAWHIAYPWRLLTDPAKITAAAKKYETAKAQWLERQRDLRNGS